MNRTGAARLCVVGSLVGAFMPGIASCEPSQWQGRTYPPVGALGKSGRVDLPAFSIGDSGVGTRRGGRRHLFDVYFADVREGWALGDDGVFRTTDGGFTWRQVLPGQKHPVRLRRVVAAGPGEAWVLLGVHGQPGGKLLHTRDGGTRWDEALAGRLKGARSLAVADNALWVLGGKAGSFVSRDEGRTWETVRFSGLLQGAYQIVVPPHGETRLYVLGQHQRRPRLVVSRDGGKRWHGISLPDDLPSGPHRYRLFFVDPHDGWLGLPDGFLLHTMDGGESWSMHRLPSSTPATSIWFFDRQRGFVAVWNGMLKQHGRPRMGEALYYTDDAGASWTSVLSGKKQVNAMFGLSTGELWAVGGVPGRVPNDLVAILRNPAGL